MPILEMNMISKSFNIRRRQAQQVLKSISLSINQGEIVGIVGESGSGKSTLGLLAVGLIAVDSGTITYKEREVQYPYRGITRREVQIIFQHPEVTFNPVHDLERSMHEPYKRYRIPYSKKELLTKLEPYGIYEEHLRRKPRSLSGGELQRLAIARVLTLSPRIIVLDEPTSMLDSISQAQIIRILEDLNKTTGITYLYITHDMSLARVFCNRIVGIHKGRLEEKYMN
jgi:peptide/nickel transport system ATP-binding protein